MHKGVGRIGRFKNVELALCLLQLFRVETAFRGKDKINDGCTAVMELTEASDNIGSSEDRHVVDTYDICTTNFVVGGFGCRKNV